MFPAACKWDDPSKKKKMKIGVEKDLFEWVGADTLGKFFSTFILRCFERNLKNYLEKQLFNYSVFTLLHRDIYH